MMELSKKDCSQLIEMACQRTKLVVYGIDPVIKAKIITINRINTDFDDMVDLLDGPIGTEMVLQHFRDAYNRSTKDPFDTFIKGAFKLLSVLCFIENGKQLTLNGMVTKLNHSELYQMVPRILADDYPLKEYISAGQYEKIEDLATQFENAIDETMD